MIDKTLINNEERIKTIRLELNEISDRQYELLKELRPLEELDLMTDINGVIGKFFKEAQKEEYIFASKEYIFCYGYDDEDLRIKIIKIEDYGDGEYKISNFIDTNINEIISEYVEISEDEYLDVYNRANNHFKELLSSKK